MTKRELLREQYEEALFALLMDDLAVSEGKKALEENERLKKDLCYIIPKESQLKCEKTIANHFTKNTIRTIGASISRAISKVAIIALISMLLFTTAFALSPSFRAHTLNLVIETFYDRTDFHFSELPSQANEKSSIEAAWLPVDFFLDAQSSDSVTTSLTYHSPNGAEIKVFRIRGSGSVLSIDTEQATVKTIKIQESDAMLASKEDTIQIAWADNQSETFVQIYGIGVTEADMIRVAENIILK